MISRTAFNLIKSGFSLIQDQYEGTTREPSQAEAQIMWSWLHPYVVVVHRRTGHGYYLDREYRHVVSVRDIDVPQSWVERELKHQPSSRDEIPPFVAPVCSPDDFDSYWLY